jgi:Ca2+/H+ antiporter, TMEM165/GDT1 family
LSDSIPTTPEPFVNLEKVIFGFFIIFACTLNFGFFIGEIDRVELHHPMELFAAVVVNLIATVLKFGDRTQLGATHLATSLVASFQLLAASMVWVWQLYVVQAPVDGHIISVVVSLSGGALLANLFSVILLLGETIRQGR